MQYSQNLVERVKVVSTGMPLRIGYAPSIVGPILGSCISEYIHLNPSIRISLCDDTSEGLKKRLLEGKLDIVISVFNNDPRDQIEWTPLWEMDWKIMFPSHHPLSHLSQAVSVRHLDGAVVLLLDKELYPEYWDKVSVYFKNHGINAKIGGEFNSLDALQAAVAGNMGVAFYGESSEISPIHKKTISTAELLEQPDKSTIAVGKLSSLSAKHIDDFIAILINKARKNSHSKHRNPS